jgi:hypothetical protein
MKKTMHEYKHHELESGRGGKAKSRKQAIAIGLSEARRAGANVPPNPHKKKATKKTATKKKSAAASKKRSTAKRK